MNLNEFHQLISECEIIDIVEKIDETNFYYFRSKNKDFEYLGYGKLLSSNEVNETSPQVILGTFEGQIDLFYFQNYILKQNNEYHLNLKNVPNFKKISGAELNIKINPIENFETWKNQVELALQKIADEDFKKIVLKRDIEITTDNLNKSIAQLLKLNNRSDNYSIYYKINGNEFISFTPEKLIEINNNKIVSMALAGSMPRTNDEIQNQENESILKNDPKLINEHQIVVDEIYNRFNHFAQNISKSDLKIMKLNYIQHRLVEIEGNLKENHSLVDIIKTLHPTPAVGTLPYLNGIQTINQIENKKRNYYAAPTGIRYKNFTDLAVMLRSATIKNNNLILHAGCGIVKGSDPKAEWDETENKTRPFIKALI